MPTSSSSTPPNPKAIYSKTWEVAGGGVYRAEIASSFPPRESAALVAMLHWHEKRPEGEPLPGTIGGQALKTIYLGRNGCGWAGNAVAPAKARFLQLALYHFPALLPKLPPGNCEGRLETLPGLTPRTVKLAAVHQQHGPGTTWEANLALTTAAIAEAGVQKVDLLCLSELFLSRGVNAPKETLACGVDSPRLTPLYEAVRQAGIYAAFSFSESDGGRRYNTALLVSPRGEVIGKYRKARLTFGELASGVSPGDDFPVFDTPLGKIGLLICWDAWFPETARMLAAKGAEIVCFPVAGDGLENHWGHVWPARAMDNQVFWLASVTGNCGGVAPSQVISPRGDLLAQTREPNALACATVELPCEADIEWLSIGPNLAEWRNVIAHELAFSAAL